MLGNKATMTPNQLEALDAITKAMQSGNETEIRDSWALFMSTTADALKLDFLEANGDVTILAQRGFRQLTQKETKFYEKLIEAGKSANPKQAMSGVMDIMPETVIEDVYKDLTEEHPLLSRITFRNVSFLTRWILNDHSVQTAVWGEINEEITKEISSAFRVVELTQCKLSAFAMIEQDMLLLGPSFLDNYIRTFLREALLCGLEKGIVNGNGKKQPIGLVRNIEEGVTMVGGAYPKKEAIKLTSFMPQEYGPLLAKLSVTEKGRKRKFTSVTLICNMADYLTKVMPATTTLNTQGSFVTNLFPFPTEVVMSNEIEDGEAIICLPEEYFMGIGSAKEGLLEFSDDFKFLEDKRVFKIKMHGMGTAFDNTSALLVDISGLDPAYITVRYQGAVLQEQVPEA